MVSLGPSKQIPEQYLRYATSAFSHLLTIDSFISYPTIRRYMYSLDTEATVTNPQRSSFGHACCLVCLSHELSPTANCVTRDLFLSSRSEKVLWQLRNGGRPQAAPERRYAGLEGRVRKSSRHCSPDGTAVHHEARHKTDVPQPIFNPGSSWIEQWIDWTQDGTGRPVSTASVVFIEPTEPSYPVHTGDLLHE